jgi:alpha-aminoadipate carrier protein LysW
VFRPGGRIFKMNCPKCDAVLEFEEDELDEGDEFTCEECGADIHVVSVEPLELEAAGDDADGGDDEDFDEDDEEFEDDEDEDEDEDFEDEDEE